MSSFIVVSSTTNGNTLKHNTAPKTASAFVSVLPAFSEMMGTHDFELLQIGLSVVLFTLGEKENMNPY